MSNPIVLPKFNLPGQRAKWVIRTLWIAGGLVAVQMVVLAVVLWNRQAPAVATLPASAPPVARTTATAPRPATPAAVAASPENQPVAAASQPSSDGAVAKREAAPSKPARRAGHRPKHGKLLAKASASQPRSGKSGSKGSGKPDAIDELLRKFK